MDFSHVVVQTASKGSSADLAAQADEESPMSPKPDPPIWSEVNRFFSNPHKPMILALARADPKKNLTTLVEAFGENKHLRDTANLVRILRGSAAKLGSYEYCSFIKLHPRLH